MLPGRDQPGVFHLHATLHGIDVVLSMRFRCLPLKDGGVEITQVTLTHPSGHFPGANIGTALDTTALHQWEKEIEKEIALIEDA